MQVSIIVAKSKNNVIGKDGGIPWNSPVDMARFKELTTGNTVVMGRKTFESIGRPLPDRQNIVLTTTKKRIPGCEVAKNLDEALSKANKKEVFIMGGEKPYEEGLELATKIYLSIMDGEYEGDTYFPEIDRQGWELAKWENQADHSFFILEKK